ncbi:ABC transporter permease, partial [Streptomyces sp. NPDC002838]|uniref:ABC transporter permease n=1 Tax=Streptomyces sp. NPDC002838 TaxID=3154436 RepID=UPI00332D033E
MAGTALAPTPAPAAPTPAPGKRSLGRALSERRTRFGLLNATPVIVYLLVLFVYPIFSTLMLSLKGEEGGFTLHWYIDAFQGANLEILLTTLRISAETSLLALVVGFVLASAISRLKPLWAGLAMLVVVVPHFISALVRTYGWIILLGDNGVVNNALTDMHVPGAPVQLLYNEIGVVIGTTAVMLPYTVLLLFAVMKGIDRRLMAAAASMGAGRITIFRRVYLPLVAPGLVNAGVLCFILCLGYYLTPALMGGE